MVGNCLTALDASLDSDTDEESEKKAEELKSKKREDDSTQVMNPEFLCLR